VLIRVHSDGEVSCLARRLEHTQAGRPRGVIDDVGALTILAERELLALARVSKRLRRDTRVADKHRALRTHRLHASTVARLELHDQRRVHPANKAELLRLALERGESTDEKPPLPFPSL